MLSISPNRIKGTDDSMLMDYLVWFWLFCIDIYITTVESFIMIPTNGKATVFYCFCYYLLRCKRLEIRLNFYCVNFNLFYFSISKIWLVAIRCVRCWIWSYLQTLSFFVSLVFVHNIFLPYLVRTPKEIKTFRASYTLLLIFCYSFSYINCILTSFCMPWLTS
jgi:hypothetical protein